MCIKAFLKSFHQCTTTLLIGSYQKFFDDDWLLCGSLWIELDSRKSYQGSRQIQICWFRPASFLPLMNDGPGPMVFCNVSCLIESWSIVFYCGGIMRSGSLVELSFGLQFASSKSIVMSGQPFLLWSRHCNYFFNDFWLLGVVPT